ncbi:hypothetical protein [Desulfovibrio cuneatus]|uniref:hypothetical protein n=1 Tax=Desulfovibrio cuneatus TaxID=159728 RepID=UPI00047FCAEB|nr:hypothetical protein [Desulfovibrio cuneatus]
MKISYAVLFIVCLVGMASAAQAKKNTEVYENFPFCYSFEYDTTNVKRTGRDEQDSAGPNHGMALFLKNEQINVWGESRYVLDDNVPNDFADDVLFLQEVASCKKVPIAGMFSFYYVCPDAVRAMARHPEGSTSNMIYYAEYSYTGKPKQIKLYEQILKTFKNIPESEPVLYVAPPAVQ